MILKDNLYRVTSMDVDNMRVDAALCPGCVIYKAHFPERPVTPGVCIIHAATELLGLLLGRECTLCEVLNAKFLSIVSPQDTPQVSFAFSRLLHGEHADTLKASVAVSSTSDNKVCAKLVLLCKTS